MSKQQVVEDLRLELFRKRISQEQVAIEAGMSQSAISRRLKGEVPSTLDEVERIANAIGDELQVSLSGLPVESPTLSMLDRPRA